MSDSITIDGVGPMPVERPSTVAELCAIVRRCADTETAIYPLGSGTMLDYGMPPARPGIALSTTALNQVIDYPARDLTITVQAGITMAELQATLAKENLWLPIDIPDTATIGGAIACDVSGPRRYGYGTLRDYVIGITVVNDRGEETHAGGRVVKNVAGYDFMKLHTGALGTLGVITQVTLKVKPKPEAMRVAFAIHSSEYFEAALDLLAATTVRPSAVESHSYPGRGYDELDARSRWSWRTGAMFEGPEEAVESQVARLCQEFERTKPTLVLAGPPTDELWSPGAYFGCHLEALVPPRNVAEFCRSAGAVDIAVSVSALPGVGKIGVSLCEREKWPLSRVQETIATLDGCVREFTGRLVFRSCPTEWKQSLPLWGHPPPDLALQKAVKQALDPLNLFNPGRFVTDAF